ncbi:DUF4244 domain-containing protein [Phytohabitans kaempferiae]|uniref:DUF4244 domain-containing protein n=1 Tax=Phytohabitans kaempferiae TaxID=1620943 RepID=A0ABV6LWZ0_9ACTN
MRVRRLIARLRGAGSRGIAARRRGVPADAGMNTAEYAVGTMAAVAFAGVLLKVLTSGSIQGALSGIIQGALK